MESTFSSPAETALQREAGVPGLLTPPEDLDRVYELERVTKFVCDLECQRVRANLESEGWLASGDGLPGLGFWMLCGLRKSEFARVERATRHSVGPSVPLEVGALKLECPFYRRSWWRSEPLLTL